MAKIQTVLGPITPSTLGLTLTHEHLALDLNMFYTAPPSYFEKYLNEKITLKNIGVLRQYPYSNRFNMTLNDSESQDAVCNDLQTYKQFGGGAIVENSSHGLSRNFHMMTRASKCSGVHIIAGTGYYCGIVQRASVLATPLEEMYDLMTRELTKSSEGPGGENIQCGVIGEVGSAWPIQDFEKRSIQATGSVQENIRCGVTFHPGQDKLAPFEVLRLHLEAGGIVDKTVMSHLDYALPDIDDLLEFASLGSFCQFDGFGNECSYFQLNPTFDWISDAQRIKLITALIDEGRASQILISNDIHTKHRLIDFGGHGYSHIINNVVPKMLIKGVTQNVIDEITIKNPQRWLEYTF